MNAERKKLENLVWKHTHRDFRGMLGNERTIMRLGKGGGSELVCLSELTDAGLVALLPKKIREDRSL